MGEITPRTDAAVSASAGCDTMPQTMKRLCVNLDSLCRQLERESNWLDKQLIGALKERDEAEEVISEIYFLIIGNSPEWSNSFGHKEAIEAIVEAFDMVREQAKARSQEPA